MIWILGKNNPVRQSIYTRSEKSQDVTGGALRPVEEPSRHVNTGGEPLEGPNILYNGMGWSR